jgi:hypothetical protein
MIPLPSLVKIQYTELKLSCGNDPVVKNYIYSNGDLDLCPNDPKINRVLPLPQGNHEQNQIIMTLYSWGDLRNIVLVIFV